MNSSDNRACTRKPIALIRPIHPDASGFGQVPEKRLAMRVRLIALARGRFAHTRMVLELGRYLVSEAGYLVTRVVSTKLSRGKRIAICDGGMNNHLPASGHFGMVVRRNYRMHKVGTERAAEASEPEPVDIVGPLCTSIDRLASGIILPPIEEGGLIAVHHSGAYGFTASPVHFISHAMPEEIMVVEDTLLRATRCFGAGTALHRHSPCPEDGIRFVEGAHPAAANQNT